MIDHDPVRQALEQSLGEEDMGQDASRLPSAAFKGPTMKNRQHGEREGQPGAAPGVAVMMLGRLPWMFAMLAQAAQRQCLADVSF